MATLVEHHELHGAEAIGGTAGQWSCINLMDTQLQEMWPKFDADGPMVNVDEDHHNLEQGLRKWSGCKEDVCASSACHCTCSGQTEQR